MSLRIVVFYGSARTTRQGIKAADFIVNTCRKRGHEVSLIEPTEYPLPLLDKMYISSPTPRRWTRVCCRSTSGRT